MRFPVSAVTLALVVTTAAAFTPQQNPYTASKQPQTQTAATATPTAPAVPAAPIQPFQQPNLRSPQETHTLSMGQEFARARSYSGNVVGYESRKPHGYPRAGVSGNSMLSALEEVCDADKVNSVECRELMAKYGDARAAWPGGMAQEFQRGRTAQGTVGYESRKAKMYSPRGANYSYGSSAESLLAAVNDFCDVDSDSAECQNAKAAYQYARAQHPTSMSAEIARARSQNGAVIGIESRKPAMYTANISENAMLATLSEVCDADSNSEACRSAIATYNQATETHAASMGQELSRARSGPGGSVGYESRKPTMYSNSGITNNSMLSALNEICDADSSSEACKSAIASYSQATETHASSMGQEFARARSAPGGTIGYESRRPTMYTSGLSSNSMLSALDEICDADSTSEACKSAIASYNQATETHAASMGQELSRARSGPGGSVGYESRQPAMYSGGITNNSMLSALDEICDADSTSEACKSAIASYNQATETHASSMGQEFARARSNQGTVGYDSRKPAMYSGEISSNPMLSALNEICDADSNSEACKSAIAKYNGAKEPWANAMSSELSRGRTAQGTVGYESRQPAMYAQGRGNMFDGNMDTQSLLTAANEVCDADSNSEACASAIAAYNGARASWSTNMGDEFGRGRTTSAAGTTTVGYASRRPEMYKPAANSAGISENTMLSTKPAETYVYALNEYCQPQAAGTAPSDDCAEAITGYLDAVGAGAAEPSPQIGAGIGSYLESIAPATAPTAGNSGAAVSGYLDSVAAGAASPPSAPAVKSYLEDVSAGAVTTPSTSGSIMSYLDTLGN